MTTTEELPRRVGPYEVLGRLGKGAMGDVYKAVQPSLNRVVAVKVLPREVAGDAESVARFEREAQAVALLNHPNVVHIIDKDRDGDVLYFVMEYVPGTSLDRVLAARRLSLVEALRVAKAVCRGLEAAHGAGITHRDLNPRNVLVSEDLSVVKLADFGISRVEAISRAQGTLSTGDYSLGTLHYMAPEQVRNMAEVDQRSDLYAVGVLLYEMLTGRLPLGRFGLPSQLNNEVPAELDTIVLQCLAAAPDDRYASASELLAALGRLEDHLRLGLVDELKGLSRTTSRMISRGTRRFAKRRNLGIAAVAVLAVAAVAAFFLLRGRPDAPPVTAAAEVAQVAVPAVEPAATPGGGEGEASASEAETSAEAPPPALGAAASPPPVAGATRERSAAPAPPARSHTPPPDPAAQELEAARRQAAAGEATAALASLHALLADHPTSRAVPAALLLTAELERRGGRAPQAIATYADLRRRFPRDERAAEAGFRQGELVLATDERDREDRARELFRGVAAAFPASPWAAQSLLAEADLELASNVYQRDERTGASVPSALVTLRTFVETFPTRAEAEKALWNLADTYGRVKSFDLAVASYLELGRRFPQTRYDAFWEAGQLLDRKLDDDARAIDAIAGYRRARPTTKTPCGGSPGCPGERRGRGLAPEAGRLASGPAVA